MSNHINKTIYHLFPGDVPFLSLQLIKSIIQNSTRKHFFIIYLKNRELKKEYINLFETLCFTQYTFYENRRIPLKERIRYIGFNLRHLRIQKKISRLFNTQISLQIELLNYKQDNLLIHGEYPMYGNNFCKILAFAKYSYSWICWGFVPNIKKRPFIYNFTPSYDIERFLKQCKYIITLTEKDQEEFQKRFHLNNIITCSYLCKDISVIQAKENKGYRILIGNSGHNLPAYKMIVQDIKKMSKLDVTFMVSYGIENQKEYSDFKKYCTSIWKDKVHFWEKTVPIDEYEQIFKNYDVYICGAEHQSGLGAATHAFFYSLKVYLNGVNYNYYNDKGFQLHHINELKVCKREEELVAVSPNEISNNHLKIQELLNTKKLSLKWDEIYDSINNHSN